MPEHTLAFSYILHAESDAHTAQYSTALLLWAAQCHVLGAHTHARPITFINNDCVMVTAVASSPDTTAGGRFARWTKLSRA